MINIFKSLAKKYSLSIITAIHQPNLQIVSTFDMLYVLAKGGVCVYSGRPQDLENHLNDCDIHCTEDQIPIEILLKIGLNGCDDQTVIALTKKTKEVMRSDQRLASRQLKAFPNGIPLQSKSFSLEELWHLLIRTIICFIRHKWLQFIGECLVYLLMAFYATKHFDFDLDKPDSCIPKVSNSCVITPEFITNTKLLSYNDGYIKFFISTIMVFSLSLAALTFPNDLKIFLKENRNCM